MKTLYFLVLFGLITNLSFGEDIYNHQYHIDNIPEHLTKKADAIIRSYDIEFEVSNLETAHKKVHRVVTLMNDNTGYDQLEVYYNRFIRVTSMEAKIFDAKGKLIKKIKKKEAGDLSAVGGGTLHGDSRVKYMSAAYGTYPYTIEFSYETVSNDTRDYPDWYIVPSSNTSVERSSYTLKIHEKLGVRYKAYNHNIEPDISQEKKLKVYTWKAKDFDPIEMYSFSPGIEAIIPMVRIAPQLFSLDGRTGDMSTWRSIGEFYYQLNEGRDELSRVMINKVNSLTQDAKTDREKVQILYKYLQDNTRYVSIQLGVGGWQTFDAAYVTKNKYGDCKALSNYMKAMLKVAGIEAYTALIYAGRKAKDVDVDFPSDAFNHVILNVKLKNEDIWLECTSAYEPPNYLGSFTENRHALLITPEGGKLVKTPHKSEKDHIKISKALVTLNENGTAMAQVINENYEDEHDVWRSYLNRKTEKEQKEQLERMIELPSFQVQNLNIKVSTKQPRADLTYDLDIKRFAKKSGKRIFMSPNLLNKRTYIPEDLEREYPIQRVKGYTHLDTIIFKLPIGYDVENIPHKAFSLDTEFGKYNMKVTVKEGELIYIRHLEMYGFSLPKEKYNDLRDFYSQLVKIDKMKIVLVNKAA